MIYTTAEWATFASAVQQGLNNGKTFEKAVRMAVARSSKLFPDELPTIMGVVKKLVTIPKKQSAKKVVTDRKYPIDVRLPYADN